jgi:asparagine synthase (glutamine-hydrolysing)
VNFVDRLRDWQQSRVGKHPWHPRAIASFESALWPNFLESFDPAIANTRVEWRHPFLDLRVLQFLLSVPPIPWARRKRLMREAMQNVLPDEVVDRDKTPLARDPEAILLQQHPLPRLSQNALAAPWVNTTNEHMLHGYLRLRIHALEFWLRSHNAGGI